MVPGYAGTLAAFMSQDSLYRGSKSSSRVYYGDLGGTNKKEGV